MTLVFGADARPMAICQAMGSTVQAMENRKDGVTGYAQ